jgi:hypothetical protein
MKFRLSLILILISVVMGYSSTTEIKIKNIKDFYDKVINDVPLLRFINSKEGIGYSYFLDFLDNQLTSDATKMNNFLDSSLKINSDKEYSYEEFLNPNYIQILKKLVDESSSFSITTKDATTLSDVLENVFYYQKDGGEYILDNQKVSFFENENGFSFKENIKIDISDESTYLLYGKINNFFKGEKEWSFYFDVSQRTLNGYFETNDYTDSGLKFDISDLEEEKIFGDILDIHKTTKNKFMSYIQEFLIPHDEFSKSNFEMILQALEDEEFILVDSRNILDDEEYSFLVFSPLELKNIEEFLNRKNINKGQLGTFDYFRLSHEKVGYPIYVYYDNSETIISTLIPENMRIYLSEVNRFKYLKTYESLENKENLDRVKIVDLERYFSNKFYSTSGSFISMEFFSDERKNFVNVHIK